MDDLGTLQGYVHSDDVDLRTTSNVFFLLPLNIEEQNVLNLRPEWHKPKYTNETFMSAYKSILDMQRIRLLNKEDMIKTDSYLIECYESTPKLSVDELIKKVPDFEEIINRYVETMDANLLDSEFEVYKSISKIEDSTLRENMGLGVAKLVKMLNAEDNKPELIEHLNYFIFINYLVDEFEKKYLSKLNIFLNNGIFVNDNPNPFSFSCINPDMLLKE